jgi:uncharacterized glyoxalase superfamily protein PhnB
MNQAATILRGVPYLPVPDVAGAGRHYETVFGFHCEYRAGDPPEFAIYARGACGLMLKRVPGGTKIVPNEAQGGTWDLFCWVDDVEALHRELASKGAVIVYPPVVQPYRMKEFAARDLNGYVLGFGQEWR